MSQALQSSYTVILQVFPMSFACLIFVKCYKRSGDQAIDRQGATENRLALQHENTLNA